MIRVKMIPLNQVAHYSKGRVSCAELTPDTYIGTDNLLQNKLGKVNALYTPRTGATTRYKKGSILIANIRPYLKKIWYATNSGGSSADVLTIDVEDDKDSKFVYYALLRDDFFNHMMKGSKGTKMPRGDKSQVLDFSIPDFDLLSQQKISNTLSFLDSKIELNNRISLELERLAKTLYDYWFVQFDFPDSNGKPYKSSGGKMVWNDKLKKEIPEGWDVLTMDCILQRNSVKFNMKGEEDNVDAIDLSVMPSGTMCLFEKNNSKEFGTNLFRLKKYDILFGGIRPYLLKAGLAPFNGVVTGTVHSFSVINENDYNFALLTMIHDSMFKFAVSNSKGTKMPVIGIDDLLRYGIAYHKDTAKKFNEIISFKEKISHNIIENHKLVELRDWLLPMLMNGQVKVE